MKYDNDRDRFSHGYDAGTIVDGIVQLDENTKEFVIIDEEGVAFSSQMLLGSLNGKRVRITCVSFDAIETIEAMMEKSQSQNPDN